MRLKRITKQNQTNQKEKRAAGQGYVSSFAKYYFLMHIFPQKWFCKVRIPRAVIQFLKEISERHHVLLSLQDKQFSICWRHKPKDLKLRKDIKCSAIKDEVQPCQLHLT